jgi:hypothetical protein
MLKVGTGSICKLTAFVVECLVETKDIIVEINDMPQPEYIHENTLIEMYGFDNFWMEKVKKPDKIINDTKLYHRDKVISLIRTYMEKFQKLQIVDPPPKNATARLRQNTINYARKAVARKQEKIPETKKALIELTESQCWIHNNINGKNDDFYLSDTAIIAYIRHYHTNYDGLLKQLKEHSFGNDHIGGKVGYEIIKDKCNYLAEKTLRDIDEDNI